MGNKPLEIQTEMQAVYCNFNNNYNLKKPFQLIIILNNKYNKLDIYINIFNK